MDSARKGLLQIQSAVILSKRFRGKINIQKPRKPYFERQLLIDVSKPFYGQPKYLLPEVELCDRTNSKFQQQDIDNPFERILAGECLDWFNTSKLVVFLHMNSISMEDKLPIFAALKRNDMHLRTYGKKIVSMATKSTRYEAVNHLFTSHQNIIFGQPESLGKMIKILKKAPQMIVMAAIIQDKLVSKNELLEISQLPNLETAQSQLCAVLQSAASGLVNQLQQGQQVLVANLDKHVELQNSAKKTQQEEKE